MFIRLLQAITGPKGVDEYREIWVNMDRVITFWQDVESSGSKLSSRPEEELLVRESPAEILALLSDCDCNRCVALRKESV